MPSTSVHLSKNRSRESTVRSELRALMATTNAGVNAAAAMTTDGMIIGSILDSRVDADRFAAMSASLLALAEREIKEIDRGRLVQLMIEGTAGAVLLVQVGENAVLAVSTNPGAIMGKIFLESKRAAQRLKTILEE